MNKKKLGLFFNSPYLGGAERSLIIQASLIPSNVELHFFIPFIDRHEIRSSPIGKFIFERFGESVNFQFVYYPRSLFEVSRKSDIFSIFAVMDGLFSTMLNFLKTDIKSFDIVWANGNKVGVVLYLTCILAGYKNRFVWFYRDYPTKRGILGKTWNLFKFPKKFSLHHYANSKSVMNSVKEIVLPMKTKCLFDWIYNPSGLGTIDKKRKDGFSSLGIVCMMAPWKGIHQIMLFAQQYKEELIDLGIKNIKIFGGEIYQTVGDHHGYQSSLEKLVSKFGLDDFVIFCGICSPNEIYSQIDILIHSSLEPEPYGRVLIEAMTKRVNVISTGQGGAGELQFTEKGDKTYLSYDAFDGGTLFDAVRSIVTDPILAEELRVAGGTLVSEVEEGIENKMKVLFGS